jgi:ATP-dependent helicase/nuclease subunit A
MSEYLADDRPISGEDFTRRACDPRASVMVEACAGSGKTWLLVGRIVRLLLAGAEPGEILAITFTRRAAQEMRARLLRDLKELARADDSGVIGFLCERGLAAAAARAAVGPARQLYERVTNARVPITIETFHGWFWRLLIRAPLGAGVPFAPVLLEATDRLRADAWLHFSSQLTRAGHAAERAAWEALIDEVGDESARGLLGELLRRRAEWWSFAAADPQGAVARALAPFTLAGDGDPRADLRQPDFVAAVQALIDLWRALARPLKTVDQAVERARRWLEAPAASVARDFRAACLVVLTKGEMTPVAVLLPERIGPRLATAAQAERYAQAHRLVVERLHGALALLPTWRARRLNEAALTCGGLLLDAYQRLKQAQQGLDFTDLEWQTHRLLADPDNAAYMHARLDARYRHVLLDEFQDTNPLQWQVLQSWFAAYGPPDDAEPGAATDRPTVFIVGDPKQSIYRFRRAEPRVFGAALGLLRRDFGATHLRTNVTRRNARALIEVLNCAMPQCNPLYQAQSTRAAAQGAFVLLPLMQSAPAAAAGERTNAALRDVLTTRRAERDSETRYREGRVLANEIAHWVARVEVARDGEGELRPARWADVLVLVRRRTHLAEYERALRDAGVPFVSDRRGGLLATLEADDLTALLEFMTAPFADLKLAHALRSPIFGCSDDDLMQLAVAPGTSWWERLQALPEPASAALLRARQLLQWWLDLAGVLPVHDLLDHIYFEGDVRRRYAAVAPGPLHAQVQANLDAFIELALAIDSGRYPSLPRFIDELSGLRRHATDDAPDEGASAAGDAVRVLTIHGAKGLEAEIVALADANALARAEGEGVLVVWPPQAAAPEHVSLVARGAAAHDAARAAWFAEEEIQRVQEDWNLLYVAATRARQVLIVSGSAPARGTLQDTWYARVQCAQPLSAGAAALQSSAYGVAQRGFREFLPEPRPTGGRTEPAVESDAQRLGRAWHALLEGGEAASREAIARTHGLDRRQMDQAMNAAERVRTALPQFFAAGAAAELELVTAAGDLLRMDRLVELDGALWILDFKWRLNEAERAAYEAQVRRYAAVVREIRSDKPLRLGLVLSDGALIEIDP